MSDIENKNENNPVIRKNSNGYEPKPLDTSNVEINENIMLLGERLSSGLHDVWGKNRVDEGWAYGPERDDEKKTNPCMMYYSELNEEQKDDVRVTAYEAIRFIMAKGYTFVERKKPSMAEIVKMAWTDYGRKESELNYNATVYIGVFGTANHVSKDKLTSALHEFYASLYERFEQKKAISKNLGSNRYDKYAHTRFVVLSPLETETELLAAKIAAGYKIDTYKVTNDAETDLQRKVINAGGDVNGFICDHSLFALAMWDGIKKNDPDDGRGDIRMIDVVERALKGSTERLLQLDMPDNITVFHMLVPADEKDTGGEKHKLYTVRELHPYPLETGINWYFRDGASNAGTTDKYNFERFERSVKKISQFNRTIKKRYSEVMREPEVGDLMPGLHGHADTDRDLLRHVYADRVSFNAQKRRDRQTIWMMATAVIGLGAYSLLSDAPDKMFGFDMAAAAPVISAVMLFFLTVAMLIFFYQRRVGSHDEYVDFRMMSECLRVQTYWKAAGVNSKVENEFGSKSKFDFEWARYILRSWELSNLLSASRTEEPFSDKVIEEVMNIWYGREDRFAGGEYRREKTDDDDPFGVDQYGYSKHKAERSTRDARRERRIRTISIAAAYGLTVVVGVLIIISSIIGGSADYIDYIALAASLVQIIVAGYSLYAGTKDYERLANNHTWLTLEYQKAIIAGIYTCGADRKRELLKKTGSEAVKEVCGWALEFSRNEPSSPIS